jgi:ribosomal-protein-alanine N-acetyltransferase
MSHLDLELCFPTSDEELKQLVELDRLCLGGLWSLDGYRREVESSNSILASLMLKNKAIGFGCFWAILEEAHITLLAVHPHYQGFGLGGFLLHTLLLQAKLMGLERATLEVRESNTIALALYDRFAFKVAGRRKRYYADGEDALILWRGNLDRYQAEQDLAYSNFDIPERTNISG